MTVTDKLLQELIAEIRSTGVPSSTRYYDPFTGTWVDNIAEVARAEGYRRGLERAEQIIRDYGRQEERQKNNS